jgi:hypothetical protein
MRLAYATVNPVTIMAPGTAITARWPFGALVPVGATGNPTGAINVIQAPPYPYTGSFMAGEQEAMALDNEQETDASKAQDEAAKEIRSGRERARSRQRESQEAQNRGEQGEQEREQVRRNQQR